MAKVITVVRWRGNSVSFPRLTTGLNDGTVLPLLRRRAPTQCESAPSVRRASVPLRTSSAFQDTPGLRYVADVANAAVTVASTHDCPRDRPRALLAG